MPVWYSEISLGQKAWPTVDWKIPPGISVSCQVGFVSLAEFSLRYHPHSGPAMYLAKCSLLWEVEKMVICGPQHQDSETCWGKETFTPIQLPIPHIL